MMSPLLRALFPDGLTLSAGELLLAVEHGPDEIGPALLHALLPSACPVHARARGEFKPYTGVGAALIDCVHALRFASCEDHVLERLRTLGARAGVAAVAPADSPTCDAALLRAAHHVIVVRALPTAAASDVHGSVHVAKRDGRWRRNADAAAFRFRVRSDGRVDVFK